MQPHSAVNDSNYDLIASPVSPWVKGESHSARMRRVDNMRRISYGPSLQPEGTISGVKDVFSPRGIGWAALTVVTGLAAGVSSGVPTGSKRSREKGMKGVKAAAALGALSGIGFAYTTDTPLFDISTGYRKKTVTTSSYNNPAFNAMTDGDFFRQTGTDNRSSSTTQTTYVPTSLSSESIEDLASIPAFMVLGALSHGFGRYVLLSLNMTKNTIPALRALGNAITGN